MKVLVSAYACEPAKGSEPEVGFRTVLAAARSHDVWVITRTNNLDSLRRALAESEFGFRVRPIGLDLTERALRAKRRLGMAGLHWYYDRWQAHAGKLARQLHQEIGFDVAHHVTFASYWTRCGLVDLDVPLVWGPVGGGVGTPLPLLPVLGWRGVVEESVRWTIRRLAELRPSFRRMQERAAVVLVQNPETRSRLRRRGGISDRVFPNAMAVMMGIPATPAESTSNVVSVGRLVPWKGLVLAIRAMALIQDPEARLLIFGEGPDRRRLERTVARLQLRDRVRLVGQVDRDQLLGEIGRARLSLHTALHEEAGLSVAESLAMGTPLVYLAIGGPRVLSRMWPSVPSQGVRPSGTKTTVRRLASAIDQMLNRSTTPGAGIVPPLERYDDVVLEAYAAAVESALG